MRYHWSALVALLAWVAGPAAAHNLPYSLVKARFDADGHYEISIECHVAALIVGVPQTHLTERQQKEFEALPDSDIADRVATAADYLRQTVTVAADGERLTVPLPVFPEIPEIHDDSRMTSTAASPSVPIRITGKVARGIHEVALSFPLVMGSVLLRFTDPQGATSLQALAPDQASAPFVMNAGQAMKSPHPELALTIVQYLRLGFTHIVPGGLDHILFVLSLFLFLPRWRPLAIRVTAFTVAHSITLALAIFDILNLPSRLTETLIAVSIVVVALDNLIERRLASWRTLIVFGFGLLHGLGFASVLQELGLPPSQKIAALLSFNVGIEVGQIFILALAFAFLGWTIGRPWYRACIAVPISVVIALIAAVWAVQRAIV